MKKQYLKNVSIVACIYIAAVLILYFGFDSSFGKHENDFLFQHLKFIDYFRTNFWATGDLFPQWTMNYGLGQSFVIFFYHGMYNPYLIIAYLLPFLSPIFIMEIIGLVIICLNAIGMTKLLSIRKIEAGLASKIAIVSSFSGVYIYHMTHHPMFIYYLPIMVFSLIGLHHLVETGKKVQYLITVALIFFLDFTLAPIISVLQFLYFTSLLVEKKQFAIKRYIGFFTAYIVGVGIGFMLLLPIAEFYMQSATRAETIPYDLGLFIYYKTMIYNVTVKNSSSGIFIVSMIAFFGAIFLLRKKSYFVYIVPMLAIIMFKPLNYAFNLFEYIDSRVYIMFIPFFWFLFGHVMQEVKRKQLIILYVITTILFVFWRNLDDNPWLTLAVVVTSIIMYILFTTKNKIATYILIVVIATGSICQYSSIIPNSELILFENANNEGEAKPYRELEVTVNNADYNYISSIYSFSPLVYTSLENSEYIKAARTEYETEISSSERTSSSETFDNPYSRNYFAIESEGYDTNPIVYGVSNDDVYAINEYSSLEGNDKLYASNQALFTAESTNSGYQSNFNFESIDVGTDTFTIDENIINHYIEIPSKYQDGILTISAYADIPENKDYYDQLYINGKVQDVLYADNYGVNDNRQVTYIFDTRDMTRLDISAYNMNDLPVVYKNLEVKYQSFDNFTSNTLDVIEPDNFEVDLNTSFDFDLTLEEDGYLATTIPYDVGFTILVDDQEVEVTKVNDLYLGAALTKGTHHIQIRYNIPGQKLGLAITAISVSVAIFMFRKENKKQ